MQILHPQGTGLHTRIHCAVGDSLFSQSFAKIQFSFFSSGLYLIAVFNNKKVDRFINAMILQKQPKYKKIVKIYGICFCKYKYELIPCNKLYYYAPRKDTYLWNALAQYWGDQVTTVNLFYSYSESLILKTVHPFCGFIKRVSGWLTFKLNLLLQHFYGSVNHCNLRQEEPQKFIVLDITCFFKKNVFLLHCCLL